MSVPMNFLVEVTISLLIGTRPKTMKQYYKAHSGNLSVGEGGILAEQDAIVSAQNFSGVLEGTLIDGMLDNLPTSVRIVQFSLKSPQQPAFYAITPIGAYGRGSTTGGDPLGERVFYTLSSNKNSPQVSRRIQHIWGVFENAQNGGYITPSVIASVQDTWTSLLCADVECLIVSGLDDGEVVFKPVAVEHTKILKNKNDGTEYFAYVLPDTYTGWSWFFVSSYSCKPQWKQFDK